MEEHNAVNFMRPLSGNRKNNTNAELHFLSMMRVDDALFFQIACVKPSKLEIELCEATECQRVCSAQG